MKKSPFKFLDSYSKEDRSIFFGRDNEIEELHSRVFQRKILVVYGISGTGKSSLINCGLANKFNDSDWLPVSIRRGMNINSSLIDSLNKCILSGIAGDNSKRDILKVLRSVYLDHFKPLFLIFDQFEEVFIFGSRSEREDFIQTVRRITNSDLQCRLIFSVREEYLAGFTEFERIIPEFLDNRIRIEKMTRQNAARAIEGPCEVNGITVDEGLSRMVLEKLNPDSPEVELTYLQVYLDKLFRVASLDDQEVSQLKFSHTEKIGDVKDLLGAFLEEQISQLEDPDTGLVILKSFVSVKGTKRQITEDEVIEYSKTLGKEIGRDTVRDLIQKFIKLRLLRDKDEHDRYELRHDSLATSIYEKITLVEKELLEIRQFIDNSWNNFERRNLYLTADDLEYIAPYEDKLFLNEKLAKFISQSKRIIHKAKRRRQNVMIISAAVIISILSFFTIWAMKERRNAIIQQGFAEEQKNAAVVAMTVADSARKEALASKDLAVRNEQIALSAQTQSEIAKKEAIAQSKIAVQQKTLAERLTIESREQARIATEEKNRAEQERQKAVEAEATATRVGNLSKAQNYALSALTYEHSPAVMGNAAFRAFQINRDNGGPEYDPVVYDALNKAWNVLDSSRHSLFTGSASEVLSIADYGGSFITTADLDGSLLYWGDNGTIRGKVKLVSDTPVRFIRIDGNSGTIITQHDNNDIRIWRVKGTGADQFESTMVENGGLLRSADFCENGRYLVTGGADSIIKVWDLRPAPVKLKSIKAVSGIMAVTFNGPDSVFYACEDGSVNLQDVKNDSKSVLHAPEPDKPLCMALTDTRLFIGYQSGSIRFFDRKSGFRYAEKSGQQDAGIDLMAFSSDYKLFATASRDKSIKLYYADQYFVKHDVYGGVVHFKDLPGRIRSLAFTKDNMLVAGLSDKSIRLWETSYVKLADKIHEKIRGSITEDSTITENR